ncbi:MAG: hypothetical protein HC905_19565 [Bacteroidales bacterium]|nr:hypothetical protein [Bacteroidales bacterium]
MNKVTLLQNQEIAPGIFSLTFKRFFEFIPGQVIKITCDQTIAPRMYSIASGNKEAYVQLVYDIKPEGELTNILKNLKSGSELLVSLPFGRFTCNENDAWWIATGTGIAPFYAMIQSEPKPEVKLIHGVRRPESLIFKDD